MSQFHTTYSLCTAQEICTRLYCSVDMPLLITKTKQNVFHKHLIVFLVFQEFSLAALLSAAICCYFAFSFVHCIVRLYIDSTQKNQVFVLCRVTVL